MVTLRPLSWLSASLSVISAAVIAFGKSCLLANMSRMASLSSSSFNYNEHVFDIKQSRIRKITWREGSNEMMHGMRAYHFAQLLASLDHALSIIAVDDENESLSVLEVVSPQWSNLVLTTDVPYGKADVFVFDCLHVKADRRNGRHNFAQFQLVQNCRFTSRIQTN